MPSIKTIVLWVAAISSVQVLAQSIPEDVKGKLSSKQEQLQTIGLPMNKDLAQKQYKQVFDNRQAQWAKNTSSYKERLPEKDRKWLEQHESRTNDNIKVFEGAGYLNQFDAKTIKKHTQNYQQLAQEVSQASSKGVEQALQQHAGLTPQQASLMSGQSQTAMAREELGIFVSFSMSDSALKKAFQEAVTRNAKVYFYGLHPEAKNIMDHMSKLRVLAKDMEEKPFARFNPKAFDQYNIQQVPAVLYRDGSKSVIIKGLTSISYAKERAADLDVSTDLGSFGPTSPVIETSFMDMARAKWDGLDKEKMKKKAIDNFWRKYQFTSLPKANKYERWYIDTTVEVKQDVITPLGDVLARAGDRINPLSTATQALTMFVFDPRDMEQVTWVSEQLNENKYKGKVELLITQVDREKGWKHLETLRNHFGQDIKMMQTQITERFKVSGVPARIETDLEHGAMKIEQFNVGEEG